MSALPEKIAEAFGFDEGTVVIKIGKENPLATFSNGKVVWVKQNEVSTFNLKLLSGANDASKDRETVIPQNEKNLVLVKLSSRTYDLLLQVAFSQLLVTVTLSSMPILGFRTQLLGQGGDLVWSSVNVTQSHTFAVRLENGQIEIFKNFEKIKTFRTEPAVG